MEWQQGCSRAIEMSLCNWKTTLHTHDKLQCIATTKQLQDACLVVIHQVTSRWRRATLLLNGKRFKRHSDFFALQTSGYDPRHVFQRPKFLFYQTGICGRFLSFNCRVQRELSIARSRYNFGEKQCFACKHWKHRVSIDRFVAQQFTQPS